MNRRAFLGWIGAAGVAIAGATLTQHIVGPPAPEPTPTPRPFIGPTHAATGGVLVPVAVFAEVQRIMADKSIIRTMSSEVTWLQPDRHRGRQPLGMPKRHRRRA